MRDFIRDAAKYFPSQVVPAIVGLVAIPLLTYTFSPAEYGDYRLVLAAIGVISPAASWVSYTTTRFYPEYERQGVLGRFYSTSLKLSGYTLFTFVALLLALLVMTRGLVSSRLFGLMLIGIGLLLTNATFSTLSNFVRSRLEPGWFSISVIIQNVVGIGVGAWLVFGVSTGISGYMLGLVTGGAVIVPLLWWRACRGVSIPWREHVDRVLGSEMLRFSYPLVLALGATWLLRLSDRFVLEAFRGSAEVGIYAASYGLADAGIGMIVTVFRLPFNVLSNRVFENEGDAAAAHFVSQSARWFLLVAIPSVVGLSMLAKPLVSVMTGAEFIEGYKIIPFVSTATLLWGMAIWYATAFQFRKRTHYQAIAIGLGAAVNIGLNLLLVPRFGFYAAGVTTLLGFLTVNLASYFFGRRLFHWRLPVTSIVRALVASLVMSLAIVGIRSVGSLPQPLVLVLGVSVGVLVYSLSLLLLKEFNGEELAQARGLLGRKVAK